VDAVGDRVEVLVDGGVRTGLDVIKMIALGAKAVLLGRAWVWALAARGEAGVAHVLKVMTADIDVALGLIGSTSIAEIDRSVLYRDVGGIASQEIAGPVPGPVPAPPI
jgi:L-lactate dehydrogenase (cytochrome)